MNKPQTAILIPVHNGLNYTSACLASLYDLLHNLSDDSTLFKIIVIDDGSTDSTPKWISENYPQTTLLTGDGNLWWSGGINLGMKYAFETLKCDYVLWWNNDIIPEKSYFSDLQALQQTESQHILIGSKIYYADTPDKIWSMGGIFDTRSGKKYMKAMNQSDSSNHQQITECDWLPGMGSLIHKTVVEKIGYINENEFPQYYGDSDFTFRAHLAGFQIRVYPQLKIWNDKSNSGIVHNNSLRLLIKSLSDIKSNNHIKKDLLFYRKYASSFMAYQELIRKYFYYIGGFFKWKFLNSFGIKKNSNHEHLHLQ